MFPDFAQHFLRKEILSDIQGDISHILPVKGILDGLGKILLQADNGCHRKGYDKHQNDNAFEGTLFVADIRFDQCSKIHSAPLLICNAPSLTLGGASIGAIHMS
jgi:hypothetical protein